MIREQAVGAVRRLDPEFRMIRVRRDADHAVLPAQMETRHAKCAVDQHLLDMELLEIDEGRHLVPGFRQEVEGVKLALALKDPAPAPGDALLHHRRGTAQPVEDFQRLLREADGTAPLADPVAVIEQDHRYALLAEINRQRQPDRPGTNDDDGMPRRLRLILIGRSDIGKRREGRCHRLGSLDGIRDT